MEIDWVLILRLVIAGLMGGLIGLEREIRAKEAGVRTHFIVALGSALFMIISQFAFDGKQHDAARVAAQVVSGIGFIGAGVIIFQRNGGHRVGLADGRLPGNDAFREPLLHGKGGGPDANPG